jgi:hypothetical protein
LIVHGNEVQFLLDRDGVLLGQSDLRGVADALAIPVSSASRLVWTDARFNGLVISVDVFSPAHSTGAEFVDHPIWTLQGLIDDGAISWSVATETTRRAHVETQGASSSMRDSTYLSASPDLKIDRLGTCRRCISAPAGMRTTFAFAVKAPADPDPGPGKAWYAFWETDSDGGHIELPNELKLRNVSLALTYRQ